MPTKAVKKTTKKSVVKKDSSRTVSARRVTTKAVKKTAVKKVAAKKKSAVKKGSSRKKSIKCSCKTTCKPAECFWVNEGPVVGTLGDLKKALKGMSDNQYNYHTKRDGNDFERWIRDCLHNKTCASKVAHARTRASAMRALGCTCS